MTSTDHNKVIGIMHLIYGGFFSLMTIMMLVFFGIFAALMSSIPQEPNAPPAALFTAIMGIFVAIYALLSVPSLVAGYAMLKHKSWARVAGVVASVLAAISFPFGTALCVYSMWFFFGEQGRDYEQRLAAGTTSWRGSLNQSSPYDWGAQNQYRQQHAEQPQGEPRRDAYQPPPPPPDWRG